MRVKWCENKRKVERVGGGNAAHWCPDAMLFYSNLDYIFLVQLPTIYPNLPHFLNYKLFLISNDTRIKQV